MPILNASFNSMMNDSLSVNALYTELSDDSIRKLSENEGSENKNRSRYPSVCSRFDIIVMDESKEVSS
jgi:hypothetical protein